MFQTYTLIWTSDGKLNKHIANDYFGKAAGMSGLCRWASGEPVVTSESEKNQSKPRGLLAALTNPKGD